MNDDAVTDGPQRAAAMRSETLDSSQVRAQHSALLLRLLWKSKESSRAELSRVTGLSRSTISAIISGLLQTGLVKETKPGISRGGRRPIVLAFDDDAYFIVGVDLGATHISVVVTNLRASIRAKTTQSFPVRTKPEGAIELMRDMIREALREAGVEKSQVLGIGVGVPSPVHPDRPGRIHPLILPKWADVDLISKIQGTYDAPVFVENDANLGALAESWWGAGRGAHNLAFIKVAYGVGSGLIVDGRIHRGRDGTAGEIGHTSLDPNGPECICGLHGCINTLVGTKRLLELVAERAPEFPKSSLGALKRRTLDHLVAAAQDNDPLAADVLRYAGQILGTAIANLRNLLAPEVIVLHGSLVRAGEPLLGPLLETVRGMSLSSSVSDTQILVSALGAYGVAVGAATLALEAALDEPEIFDRRQRASA